ncbi:MAG: CPBP family intramembrane metalloprotease [Desulfovibrionaceae bacterium]|jgi:membrane protease YdiL (CAAX protease family)|nr:CPBP family intramembrane metalloprotease [Desulfovibrionaceae bacterium]
MPVHRSYRAFADGVRRQIRLSALALADPLYYGSLALGFLAWFSPVPKKVIAWEWLLVKAYYEEFLFRFLIQEALDRLFKRRFRLGPLSLANVLASLSFCMLHLPSQGVGRALLVFFPSLIFGWAWDRYRSILPVGFLHFFYNYCLFYRFGVPIYFPLFGNGV